MVCDRVAAPGRGNCHGNSGFGSRSDWENRDTAHRNGASRRVANSRGVNRFGVGRAGHHGGLSGGSLVGEVRYYLRSGGVDCVGENPDRAHFANCRVRSLVHHQAGYFDSNRRPE